MMRLFFEKRAMDRIGATFKRLATKNFDGLSNEICSQINESETDEQLIADFTKDIAKRSLQAIEKGTDIEIPQMFEKQLAAIFQLIYKKAEKYELKVKSWEKELRDTGVEFKTMDELIAKIKFGKINLNLKQAKIAGLLSKIYLSHTDFRRTRVDENGLYVHNAIKSDAKKVEKFVTTSDEINISDLMSLLIMNDHLNWLEKTDFLGTVNTYKKATYQPASLRHRYLQDEIAEMAIGRVYQETLDIAIAREDKQYDTVKGLNHMNQINLYNFLVPFLLSPDYKRLSDEERKQLPDRDYDKLIETKVFKRWFVELIKDTEGEIISDEKNSIQNWVHLVSDYKLRNVQFVPSFVAYARRKNMFENIDVMKTSELMATKEFAMAIRDKRAFEIKACKMPTFDALASYTGRVKNKGGEKGNKSVFIDTKNIDITKNRAKISSKSVFKTLERYSQMRNFTNELASADEKTDIAKVMYSVTLSNYETGVVETFKVKMEKYKELIEKIKTKYNSLNTLSLDKAKDQLNIVAIKGSLIEISMKIEHEGVMVEYQSLMDIGEALKNDEESEKKGYQSKLKLLLRNSIEKSVNELMEASPEVMKGLIEKKGIEGIEAEKKLGIENQLQKMITSIKQGEVSGSLIDMLKEDIIKSGTRCYTESGFDGSIALSTKNDEQRKNVTELFRAMSDKGEEKLNVYKPTAQKE